MVGPFCMYGWVPVLYLIRRKISECCQSLLNLRPSKKRLVTDGNTKLCCRGFVLAIFQSTTAYKIDSEHTLNYTKLFLVCKVEII